MAARGGESAAASWRSRGLCRRSRLPEQIEDAAQRRGANGDRDRRAGVDGFHAAHEALRLAHGHGADGVVAQMAGDLAREVDAVLFVINRDGVD